MGHDTWMPSDRRQHPPGTRRHSRNHRHPHTPETAPTDQHPPVPPATPDAVTDRLSQHLRNGPPQCQVQFPIGAGRVPVAGEQPRTVIQIDVVVPSASEDRSVSVRILAVPGAYLLVAQAVTPQRCTFDCLTIHLPECAR